MKQVQIPLELFVYLIKFHLYDTPLWEAEIKTGLEQKLDSILTRLAYSEYKKAPTEAEREAAKQKYLERKNYLKNLDDNMR